MSVKVSAWVWHGEETSALSGNELVMMLALADVSDDDGRCRFVDDEGLTYGALAEKVRVDRRTVIRLTAKLREQRLLDQIPGQNGRPNEFTIIVPWASGTGDNLSLVAREPVTPVHGTGDKSSTPASLIRIDVFSPSVGFAEFYMAYPRKVGKEAARKAFEKAAKTTDPEVIVAGARRYAADPNLPEKQFIPYPATWLARGSWDDEPEVERPRVVAAPSMADFEPGDEWMAFR